MGEYGRGWEGVPGGKESAVPRRCAPGTRTCGPRPPAPARCAVRGGCSAVHCSSRKGQAVRLHGPLCPQPANLPTRDPVGAQAGRSILMTADTTAWLAMRSRPPISYPPIQPRLPRRRTLPRPAPYRTSAPSNWLAGSATPRWCLSSPAAPPPPRLVRTAYGWETSWRRWWVRGPASRAE